MAARERVIARGADLVDGGDGVRFTIGRQGAEVPAFAIRFHGIVHAYVNRCAHREVELDWIPGAFFDIDGEWLVCATHGAVYAPDSGRCVAGPCVGAALAAIPIRERVEDGAIVLCEPSRVAPCDESSDDQPRRQRGDHG